MTLAGVVATCLSFTNVVACSIIHNQACQCNKAASAAPQGVHLIMEHLSRHLQKSQLQAELAEGAEKRGYHDVNPTAACLPLRHALPLQGPCLLLPSQPCCGASASRPCILPMCSVALHMAGAASMTRHSILATQSAHPVSHHT